MAEALGVSRSELLLRHTVERACPTAFGALVDAPAWPTSRWPRSSAARNSTAANSASRRDVLIPRADSETIVAAALEACPRPRAFSTAGPARARCCSRCWPSCRTAQGIGIDRSPRRAGGGAGQRRRGSGLSASRRDAPRRLARSAAGARARPASTSSWPIRLMSKPAPSWLPSVRELRARRRAFRRSRRARRLPALVPQLPALLAPGGVAVLEIGAAQAAAVVANRGKRRVSRANCAAISAAAARWYCENLRLGACLIAVE